jgi:hypothetical protein
LYRSPEDSMHMKAYRAAMSECIKLPRCTPVAPNNYDAEEDGSAMMGLSEVAQIVMGAGGGHGGGRGGAGHGGGGRHGFNRPGRGGFVAYGGPWAGFPFFPWYNDYGVLANPCDINPRSYECFLARGGAGGNAYAAQQMVMGDGSTFYSRVQAENLLPRVFPSWQRYRRF